MAKRKRNATGAGDAGGGLLQELVTHFQEQRQGLRRIWVQQMTAKGLLAGLSKEEIETDDQRRKDMLTIKERLYQENRGKLV